MTTLYGKESLFLALSIMFLPILAMGLAILLENICAT